MQGTEQTTNAFVRLVNAAPYPMILLATHFMILNVLNLTTLEYSDYHAGGVQVGSPEPPFKINDIHSMHVVEVLVYTHLLALIHINYETEIDSR